MRLSRGTEIVCDREILYTTPQDIYTRKTMLCICCKWYILSCCSRVKPSLLTCIAALRTCATVTPLGFVTVNHVKLGLGVEKVYYKTTWLGDIVLSEAISETCANRLSSFPWTTNLTNSSGLDQWGCSICKKVQL